MTLSMSSASSSGKLLQHDFLDAVSVLGIVQMLKHEASYGETAGLNRPWKCESASLTLKLIPNGIEYPLELRKGLRAASVGSSLRHVAYSTTVPMVDGMFGSVQL
jgi:hypothetical protein